ncbi:TetR/AcrR family transcriptional regulator [Paenibacillus sp. N3.4]|uniref:TetR/AcrR family transcriptional regulator n=1 Tax=Paenibacillus sp. N3.4 TaxID=2603222 RepID=UPI0011C88307|nr:TetR/AcrR family transcriptional regulator [Paenibacillus sp. N3.4]TXK81836.1 TetR/AcrR family transcriptional regulator [Paenibacillus sp. N3.4]
MNNTNRTVISRRSRPAKEPLSKELIVKTALELLENEGAPGLSMRRVAKALDTGPSSLYVYVTNLQELSAYVLDGGLHKVVLPDVNERSWKSLLFEMLFSYQKVLYECPGIAELALTTIPIGPYSLAITEYILARLHEGGISSTSAAWGVDLLLLYTSSVAFEQVSRIEKGTPLHALSASYQSLNAMKYPMLTALKDVMTGGEMTSEGHERFLWGLEVILQGILHVKS